MRNDTQEWTFRWQGYGWLVGLTHLVCSQARERWSIIEDLCRIFRTCVSTWIETRIKNCPFNIHSWKKWHTQTSRKTNLPVLFTIASLQACPNLNFTMVLICYFVFSWGAAKILRATFSEELAVVLHSLIIGSVEHFMNKPPVNWQNKLHRKLLGPMQSKHCTLYTLPKVVQSIITAPPDFISMIKETATTFQTSQKSCRAEL